MATKINVGLFQAETWEELKELLVGMTRGMTGNEPTFPDSWYQEKFAELQGQVKADREGHSESPQEG